MRILSVDVGTTALKMGVFQDGRDGLRCLHRFTADYAVNTYNNGLFADIEPEKWQRAFAEGCRALGDLTGSVDVVALSGTTPGLTAMDREGRALYPAILMLDQRSRSQARRIIETVGRDVLLAHTANIPVAGGCSLASILWIRDNLPDVYRRTFVFGHSNTYMARWLGGGVAMDPSSASLTALYNTTANDMRWNGEMAACFDLPLDRLPRLTPAWQSVGRVRRPLAAELGLKKEPPVVIGGNDAVLAAYSVGIREPGEVFNINGTCEITMTCLDRCLPSENYNIRTHVLPGRWFSFHVMNAQGKAFEWFHHLFCREMTDERFFGEFLPGAVDAWLERESSVTYVPYLMGSRYSQEPLRAAFEGLTVETTRREMLAALVRGLCRYQGRHLDELSRQMPLTDCILVSGGAVNEALMRAKRRWMRDCDYRMESESSMMGAAQLGRRFLRSQ